MAISTGKRVVRYRELIAGRKNLFHFLMVQWWEGLMLTACVARVLDPLHDVEGRKLMHKLSYARSCHLNILTNSDFPVTRYKNSDSPMEPRRALWDLAKNALYLCHKGYPPGRKNRQHRDRVLRKAGYIA